MVKIINRDTCASPVAASPQDDSSSDELVIDFNELPCASKYSRSKHHPEPQPMATQITKSTARKQSSKKRQLSAPGKKRCRPKSSSSNSNVANRKLKTTLLGMAVSNLTQESVTISQTMKPSSPEKELNAPDEQADVTIVESDTIFTPTGHNIESQIQYITDSEPTVADKPFVNQNPSHCDLIFVTNQNPTNETAQTYSIVGNFFEQISIPHESSYRRYILPSSRVPVISTEQEGPVEPSKRKYRFIQNLFPVTVTYTEGQTGFTEFQRKIFQQQLRMHVQLAAQNFMQTYAHPKFWEMATKFKDMLLDLQKTSGINPAAETWNLDGALKCCTSWEKELEIESEENTEFIDFLLKEFEKSEKAKESHKYYRASFHPKLMEWIATKNVFMYPKLLPHSPFRMDFRADHRFIKAEEQLVAFGLEMFYKIAKEDLSKDKKKRNKHPPLSTVCKYISKYLCPLYSAEHLSTVISAPQRRRGREDPIKYYFKHLKAMPFQHVLERIDFDNVIPPASYQKGEIPDPWDTYLYSAKRLAMIYKQSTSIENKKTSEPCSLQPQCAPSQEANGNITFLLVVDPQQTAIPLEQCTTLSSQLPKSFQIDQQWPNEPCTSVVQMDNNKASEVIEPECRPYQAEIKHELPISIDDSHFGENSAMDIETPNNETDEDRCCHCNCNRFVNEQEDNQPQNKLEKGQKLITDYFHLSSKSINLNDKRRKGLKQKLWEIYQRFQSSQVHRINRDQWNWFLRKVFDHFCLIERFSSLFNELKTISSSNGVQMQDDRNSILIGLRTRLQRLSVALDTGANDVDNFVQKVENTLLSANRLAQYESFLEIFRLFDPADDRVTDLYNKIENLLMIDNPELVDLFLTFLLTGQASKVAKFFEYLILTNRDDFLTMLNIYFAKQPTQIENINACLLELSSDSDVKIEQIKICILQLLKGNPLLIEWFHLLFNKPLESSHTDTKEPVQ